MNPGNNAGNNHGNNAVRVLEPLRSQWPGLPMQAGSGDGRVRQRVRADLVRDGHNAWAGTAIAAAHRSASARAFPG